jgi:hypothetical protein
MLTQRVEFVKVQLRMQLGLGVFVSFDGGKAGARSMLASWVH